MGPAALSWLLGDLEIQLKNELICGKV